METTSQFAIGKRFALIFGAMFILVVAPSMKSGPLMRR